VAMIFNSYEPNFAHETGCNGIAKDNHVKGEGRRKRLLIGFFSLPRQCFLIFLQIYFYF